MMAFAELDIVNILLEVDKILGGRNQACSRLGYGILSLCGAYQRFGATYCLCLQIIAVYSPLPDSCSFIFKNKICVINKCFHFIEEIVLYFCLKRLAVMFVNYVSVTASGFPPHPFQYEALRNSSCNHNQSNNPLTIHVANEKHV